MHYSDLKHSAMLFLAEFQRKSCLFLSWVVERARAQYVNAARCALFYHVKLQGDVHDAKRCKL